MFIFSSILVYFFSIVIAISAMTFIVLLTMVNEVSRRRQFFFLMSFCACNFLIEILYLCMTIQDSLLHYYHYNLLVRIADTALYTLQSFSWCRYLLYFPSRNPASDRRSKSLCNVLTAVSLILGVTSYAFLVNNEFLFTSSLGVIFDLIVSLLLSIMLICTAVTRKRSDSQFNRFNLIISCMLILIQWWTSIFMVFESHISFSFEIHEYLGGATQQMLVILALAVYVYKTDYSGVTLRQQLQSLIAKNAANSSDTANAHSVSKAAADAVTAADNAGNAADHTSKSADSDSIRVDKQSICRSDNSNTAYAYDVDTDNSAAVSADTGTPHTSVNAAKNSHAVSDTVGFAADAVSRVSAAGGVTPHVFASDSMDADDPMPPLGSVPHNISGDADMTARPDMSGQSLSDTLVSSVSGTGIQTDESDAETSHTGSGNHHLLTADVDDDGLSDIERIFDEKQLTKREREVARLAYTGLTNPEIADKLCISQHTVKRHMHSIFEKLNISARIELVHLMNRM